MTEKNQGKVLRIGKGSRSVDSWVLLRKQDFRRELLHIWLERGSVSDAEAPGLPAIREGNCQWLSCPLETEGHSQITHTHFFRERLLKDCNGLPRGSGQRRA